MSGDKIPKEDRLILVVPRVKPFGSHGEDAFQGFSAADGVDFQARIIDHRGFMTRGSAVSGKFAEADENYKQPIPYVAIVNPETKKVFAYQRASKDAHYGETRLQGKWSWGVGGHVDYTQAMQGRDNNTFLHDTLERELDEEVKIEDGLVNSVATLGYINDDEDSVGRVHFGVLYVVETNATRITPKDSEIARGEFLSVGELEELCASDKVKVEGWSKIALAPLRQYLQ